MESAFLKIIDARALTPPGLPPSGQIITSDGKIVEIAGQNREIPHAGIINAKGHYVALGCIGTHVHGDNGHDFTEATPKAFYAITRAHTLQGTTALYPTLAAAPIDTFRGAIKAYEHIMDHPEQGARIMGSHLEDNYLDIAVKGGQDPNYIYPPDPQEYKELPNSTQCIKRWSAAPELDGALEFGKYASAHGVLISPTHTIADYLQVKKACKTGFTHATHLYNTMTSVYRDREYKHEGTVEGICPMKDMTVEVITDDIHIPPAVLELVYQIKGVERTSLITGAMAAAAYDNGTEYSPDSWVIIEEGVCKLADRSAIAEDIATGIRLIRTLVEKAEIPLRDAVRMASESPTRLVDLSDHKGTLEKGKDTNIIILNNDIEIQRTFIEGKRFSKE